ncbi:hypothetical protein F441_02861 [Phytophthora nicotianae CJ01A1]|uniref:Uncharacterized protein n=3 Tax=Phytophthora nicotianae TaxID=4792 RepID=W2XN44_PHYNI|nr:hypothetical protein L917_02675 [Phytophthora nicotianae]ETO83025.1 hypothetical protein F444_02897 [Phytophthora nicotianae P1976]ETP24091.1 hypothetical protein F441_02861 [Phytophthora nicotianae CJ01A1]
MDDLWSGNPSRLSRRILRLNVENDGWSPGRGP